MRFSTIFIALTAIGLATAAPADSTVSTVPTDEISAIPQGNATYMINIAQIKVLTENKKPIFNIAFHVKIDSPRPAQRVGHGFCVFIVPSDKVQNVNWISCDSDQGNIYFQWLESKDKKAWVFTPAHTWGAQFIDYADHRIPKTLFKETGSTPQTHQITYTGPRKFNISKGFNPSLDAKMPKGLEGMADLSNLFADGGNGN